MTDVDWQRATRAVDRADALGVTRSSWEQWAFGRRVEVRAPESARAIVVAGMGGSGIAGDVLAAVGAERLDVPVLVHRDADLPGFVGPGTLVLAVSYSGGTHEVLATTERALAKGAPVVAVTAGGALAGIAEAAGMPVVALPPGYQPRHALGLLAGTLLAICGLGHDLGAAEEAARRVAENCAPEVPDAANPAKRLGAAVAAVDLVVAWGVSGVAAAAARRLASQLNEHAKLPAYAATLPELAHNEVVGWQEPGPATCAPGLVVMRDPQGESPPARARVRPALAQVGHRVAWVEELSADGGPALARLAGLAMVADLASVYAAIARGVDPTPTPAIDALKAALDGATEEGEK